MLDNLTWRQALLAPFAIYLAIKVGMPMASARNEAALPLLGSCPSAIFGLLSGNPSVQQVGSSFECMVGTMLIVAIPGALGVGLMVMKEQ